MEAGAGHKFRINRKIYTLVTLRLPWGAFQLANRFIKSPPPPPPPLPPSHFFFSFSFISYLLLSRPRAECLLLCPAPSPRASHSQPFPPVPPSAHSLHRRRTHQPPPLPVRVALVPSPAAHRRRSLLGSVSHQHAGATPSRHLQFPTGRFSAPAMVRTRGAHRYRPRVQFSTRERDGVGPSRASAAHSPNQGT